MTREQGFWLRFHPRESIVLRKASASPSDSAAMMIRTKAEEARLMGLVLCALVVAPGVTALPSGVNPETLLQLMLPIQTALKGERLIWTL